MGNMLEGLPFATAYLGDIVILNRTVEEYGRHLHAVFNRINDYGFRVRLDKCAFFQRPIKFLGFIVGKDGRLPEPQRFATITDISAPNVSTLRSLIGMKITRHSSITYAQFASRSTSC
jgi:hypothetical protein